MNWIGSTTIATFAALALGLSGCDQDGGEAATSPSDVDMSLPDDVPIPSAEEADADAAREITEENADAAFDELTREIESELEEEDG